jgi:hypothetical protein
MFGNLPALGDPSRTGFATGGAERQLGKLRLERKAEPALGDPSGTLPGSGAGSGGL